MTKRGQRSKLLSAVDAERFGRHRRAVAQSRKLPVSIGMTQSWPVSSVITA